MNKRKLVLGSLLVILVFSSFSYLYVNAHDDEDEDGIEDDIEDDNERDVSVEYSPSEVKIHSSIYNNGIENSFEIQVKTESDGLRLELEYEEDNDTVETEIEFEVTFNEIIEFRDLNSNGTYEESIDDEIQILPLEDFESILYTVETIDNETVHVLFVETTDEVFSSTIYVSGKFTVINGVLVTPNEIKVDVGIHNFDYNESDTQLALRVNLDSESDVDYEDDEETEDEEYGHTDDEHGIEVSLDEFSGFFTWTKTVMVDDVAYNVSVTPLEIGTEENTMYFNYPRGTEIIHDPKIGIEGILQFPDPGLIGTRLWFEFPNMSQTDLLIVSAVTFAVLTGLVLIFRRKNK